MVRCLQLTEKFHYNLEDLKNSVIQMGVFACDMLSNSVRALKESNITLAEEVYEQKNILAEMDEKIEQQEDSAASGMGMIFD